jgi:hypothetical protein
VYSLVWASLCLKFYLMFYLEIKSTIVILWSIFIPLKINNAINNIYQLVLISCAILSLISWPLIPLTTIPKSEKFRFPKRVWSHGFRIRDCVPVVSCILLERLRKFAKNLSQDSQISGPRFERWIPEYEAEVTTTQPWRSERTIVTTVSMSLRSILALTVAQ